MKRNTIMFSAAVLAAVLMSGCGGGAGSDGEDSNIYYNETTTAYDGTKYDLNLYSPNGYTISDDGKSLDVTFVLPYDENVKMVYYTTSPNFYIYDKLKEKREAFDALYNSDPVTYAFDGKKFGYPVNGLSYTMLTRYSGKGTYHIHCDASGVSSGCLLECSDPDSGANLGTIYFDEKSVYDQSYTLEFKPLYSAYGTSNEWINSEVTVSARTYCSEGKLAEQIEGF